MNSDLPNREPDDSPPADVGAGVKSLELLLLVVSLLAVALLGVFVWDTWKSNQPVRPMAGEPEMPVADRETAETEETSSSEEENETGETTPDDAGRAIQPEEAVREEVADSLPDPAPDPAPDRATAPAPDPAPHADPNCADDEPAESAPDTLQEEGTRILAALDPIENDGVQREGDSLGQTVRVSGSRHDQAICVEPSMQEHTAQVAFSLKGNWARLLGIAGITGAEESNAAAEQERSQAIFRIYGDANLLWESQPLSGGGVSEKFEVDVAQLDILALVVESQRTSADARPVWADLRLVPSLDDQTDP